MVEFFRENTTGLSFILFGLVILLFIIRVRNLRYNKVNSLNNHVPSFEDTSKYKPGKMKKLISNIIIIIIAIPIAIILNKTVTEKKDALESASIKLTIENNALSNEIKLLNDEKASLSSNMDEKQMIISQLENSLSDDTKKVPNNYYYKDSKDGSSDDLINYLNDTFDMPVNYKLHVFDCSEEAAFMERELENAGFDSYIVLGDSPSGGNAKHAWVIVYTSDDYRVAIEPTALLGGMDGETQKMFASFSGKGRGIVYKNENSNYYDIYDYMVADIYEAIEIVNFEEFDWWYGMWDLEVGD